MLNLLLLISGTVHPNPGPNTGNMKSIELCLVNMRSIMPSDCAAKLDELYSILCIKEKFDILCVSESWLDNIISDDAVKLPDYQIFKNYRNRHAGSMAIYAHNSLPVKLIAPFGESSHRIIYYICCGCDNKQSSWSD